MVASGQAGNGARDSAASREREEGVEVLFCAGGLI